MTWEIVGLGETIGFTHPPGGEDFKNRSQSKILRTESKTWRTEYFKNKPITSIKPLTDPLWKEHLFLPEEPTFKAFVANAKKTWIYTLRGNDSGFVQNLCYPASRDHCWLHAPIPLTPHPLPPCYQIRSVLSFHNCVKTDVTSDEDYYNFRLNEIKRLGIAGNQTQMQNAITLIFSRIYNT